MCSSDLSTNGTVIGVEVFTRDGVEKDERTNSIEADHLADAQKDSDDEIRIVNQATKIRLVDLIKGNKVVKGTGLKKGSKPNASDLSELELDSLLSVRTDNENANTKIEDAEKQLKKHLKEIKEKFEERKQKITRGHDLAPGEIGRAHV